MRHLFKLRLANRPFREKYKMYVIIPEFNHIYFGQKRFRASDPNRWSSKPYHIKSSEKLEFSKRTILSIGMENDVSVRFVILVNISF